MAVNGKRMANNKNEGKKNERKKITYPPFFIDAREALIWLHSHRIMHLEIRWWHWLLVIQFQ